MSKIALEGQLSETVGTVTVSASPGAGGQLVTGVTNAYDVTICVPVAPVRLKWRIGTSGDWRETEGGECFTVSGGDAQSLYLAKQSEQSASVVATYTMRQLTSVSAAGLTVPIVTYSQTPSGGFSFGPFSPWATMSAAGPVTCPDTTQSIMVCELPVKGGVLGKNGRFRVTLDIANRSANQAVVSVYTSDGGAIFSVGASGYSVVELLGRNNNCETAQISSHLGYRRVSHADTRKDFSLYVLVSKSNAADVVIINSATLDVSTCTSNAPEGQYHNASGMQVVTESDLLLSPLPSRVTDDPLKSVRALRSTEFAFPDKFFALCSSRWPLTGPIPDVSFSTFRTHDTSGVDWAGLATSNPASDYSPVTGSAPAGIDAAKLAKLDDIFAAANANGKELIYNVTSGAQPAWVSDFGVSATPVSIPVAGANRTAYVAALSRFVKFIVQRYTTMYPSLKWYVEPINEPNTPGIWSGVAADLSAFTNAIYSPVTNFSDGKVKTTSPSYTDWTGLTASNGHLTPSGLIPPLEEFIGAGGWANVDIGTYHLYRGGVSLRNLNSADIDHELAGFEHDLRIIDPLQTEYIPQLDRCLGLPRVLNGMGVLPDINGPLTATGKEWWVTECGDSGAAGRDRDYFVRISLIAAAMGVTRYFWFFWTGAETNLRGMDIARASGALAAAQQLLQGATIQWVNANRDLTKVAASINGSVMTF